MAAFEDACAALAGIIGDYRQGAVPVPDASHVSRWARQFSPAAQLPVVAEMTHVLGKSYFSRNRALAFLDQLVGSKKLCGDDPIAFWQSTRLLDLQQAGNSQRELLALFEPVLQARTGLSLSDCGQHPQRYLYLDDGLFSGGRIKTDLAEWIAGAAPANAEIYIVVIAAHEQGAYFALQDLPAAAVAANKALSFKIRYAMAINDKIFDDAMTDVLRPTGPGADPGVAAYVNGLGKEQKWRTMAQQGSMQFFTGEPGRALLEQEFLLAGVEIRAKSPYLNIYQRPLGNTTMRTTGFGTMFVTWRNCPNNAPLVLWAGNPWYPLFPRITN